MPETLELLYASLPSSIDTTSGTVKADPTQMQQVLTNLCDNAEQAMRETDGVLELRLNSIDIDTEFARHHPPLQPGPHVRLTIQDTGCGMTPEVQEHLFEPFFTSQAAQEGTGMSLAVVHGIITNHRGAITVDSAPGRGTTCEV